MSAQLTVRDFIIRSAAPFAVCRADEIASNAVSDSRMDARKDADAGWDPFKTCPIMPRHTSISRVGRFSASALFSPRRFRRDLEFPDLLVAKLSFVSSAWPSK